MLSVRDREDREDEQPVEKTVSCEKVLEYIKVRATYGDGRYPETWKRLASVTCNDLSLCQNLSRSTANVIKKQLTQVMIIQFFPDITLHNAANLSLT